MRSLSGWVVGLLVINIATQLAAIGADQKYIDVESKLIDRNFTNFKLSDINSAQHAVNVTGIAQTATFILAAILFIAWFHRSYRNLHRVGITGLRYRPGWAIGAWFVPFMNLVRPKKIANDIWRAAVQTEPTATWQERPLSSRLNWWWAVYLTGNLLSWASGRLIAYSGNQALTSSTVDSTLKTERSGFELDELSSIVLVVAAVLAILVVRRITKANDERLIQPPPAE